MEGLPSKVAFDVVDQLGASVSIKGELLAGDQKVANIATSHEGRGTFTVTPGDKRLKARFTWRGKSYSFNLPKAEQGGVVVSLDGDKVTVRGNRLAQGRQYGLSILCRGALQHFSELALEDGGKAVTVQLPTDELPDGVNDLTVFDDEGRILADRLFFKSPASPIGLISPIGTMSPTKTYEPYEPITVGVQLPTPNTTFSLSVRDAGTDEPTYNNGNLMTDLLLSSELRGFIANPAYYFEKDDAEHRRNLDLLMMVQGWRKYKWEELSDTARQMRYEPEQTMTVSGEVYKMLSVQEVELDEVPSWKNGVGMIGIKNKDAANTDDDPWAEEPETEELELVGNTAYDAPTASDVSSIELGDIMSANDELGINHSTLKRDVLIEAELMMGDEIVAGRQKTVNGRFVFEIPPFYGATFLNLKAYKEKDSLRKAMMSRSDATVFREDAYADFFVKRDMPYPVFTHKYNYYENHAPEWDPSMEEVDTLSELSMENDVHQLQNVNVRGHRRGRRAIDWNKPAFVRDAYDLYNDLTDYGLSFGKFDMRQFPLQVAKFLFGNMGRPVHFNVDGRLDGKTYWRNYDSTGNMTSEMAEAARANENTRSAAAVYNNLKLARLQDIRVFSDYEPRNEDSTMVVSQFVADATVEMVPIPDDGVQVVYRDRHIYLHGMNEAVSFYQPDYSERQPAEPSDYRRTLYWNPNARSDEDGRFTTTFYNNSKETRIKMSAAGVTPDGCLLYY